MEELHHRYPSMSELEVRSLLAQVRLTGENVFKETGVISGGERAKLCFAIMMQEHGNVLILDEPTNHLDLASKQAIKEALEEYTGTVIFVSHDRYLLSKIADRIIELKPNGSEIYEFGFEKYMDVFKERQNAGRTAAELDKQHKAEEAAKDKSAKVYKTKQQRSIEAARRNQIKKTEEEIEELQQQLDALNEEITKEDVFSDYELMNSKCIEIEKTKQKIDDLFDVLIELDA